jgi:hypothetical protein
VDNDGKVEKVWQGKWGLAEVNEARAVFDLDLSETKPPPELDGQMCRTTAFTPSP